ncbi:hypothetical protein [Streptomyces nigra]|uniref:hypothetical protein n=1 Tax=Streptomyces nigra TaxID=1827580 RepID=UPI00362BE48F
MPSRFEYERAIRSSDLPSLSRLLALTIATWADVRTGIIPDRRQPSLTVLEESTGMVRASVRTHLTKLESGGWLKRDRPSKADARVKKARTHYALLVPVAVEPDEPDEPDELAEPDDLGGSDLGQELPSPGAGDAPDQPELGQELPPARAGDALDEEGLGQEVPQARAGDAPELGQEMTPARAGAALNSSLGPVSTNVPFGGEAAPSGPADASTPGDTRDAQDEVLEGEPVDEAQPAEPDAITAQTIVGEWLERCASRPPSRVIGQMAKEIRVLLDEDHVHPDIIRRGIARWMQRGLHPSTLPSVVNEVMNAQAASPRQSAGPGYDPTTGTDLFDRAMARAKARDEAAAAAAATEGGTP